MDITTKDMNDFFGLFPPKSFADGKCYIIGAFGNVGAVETNDGLVLVDVAPRQYHKRIFTALRKFSTKPVKYIIYSHGHFDHCFGYVSIIKEAEEKGWDRPDVIAHENILRRFEKYRRLEKYHVWLNSQQFSSIGLKTQKNPVSARETLNPTIVLKGNDAHHEFTLGNTTFEVFHDKGETDDSLWVWVPDKKTIFAGDLVINPSFPNIGNPNKVQRYPHDWAIAMEKMLEKDAEFIVPGHGKLIEGKKNVKEALSIRAEAMHFIHDEVVKRLNEGKWFEKIYHEMMDIYPEKFKNHEFLRDTYGCYRFGIHAAYRLYHGWYDTGNPTDLFPARSEEIAKEYLHVSLPEKFLEHGKELYKRGKLQLALHMLDVLIKGKELVQKNLLLEAYEIKAKILKEKAREEISFIARNSYYNGIEELKMKIKELKS
ncbi:MAG: alkyl sulfatase dimerization domain-containing protein [Promethearchaeota archaeon]